jgi:hypothetical protein
MVHNQISIPSVKLVNRSFSAIDANGDVYVWGTYKELRKYKTDSYQVNWKADMALLETGLLIITSKPPVPYVSNFPNPFKPFVAAGTSPLV